MVKYCIKRGGAWPGIKNIQGGILDGHVSCYMALVSAGHEQYVDGQYAAREQRKYTLPSLNAECSAEIHICK